MLCGYCRPRIILPDIAPSQNSLTGILAHELTHYRRRDLWVKLLCVLATSVHWFNPLVHIAAGRCNAEMELSCDEAVLAGFDEDTRRSYGNVMLDIIKRCGKSNGALTTQFNTKKSAVKERFYTIMDMTKKKRGLWIIAAAILLYTVAGTVIGCNVREKVLTEGHWYVEGQYLRCDIGADMIIVDAQGKNPSYPCSMTAENDGVSFADLTDGDRIRIEVMLIGETYPAQTQVYSVEKLSDGEKSDINAELLAQLAEMGWIDEVPQNEIDHEIGMIFTDDVSHYIPPTAHTAPKITELKAGKLLLEYETDTKFPLVYYAELTDGEHYLVKKAEFPLPDDTSGKPFNCAELIDVLFANNSDLYATVRFTRSDGKLIDARYYGNPNTYRTEDGEIADTDFTWDCLSLDNASEQNLARGKFDAEEMGNYIPNENAELPFYFKNHTACYYFCSIRTRNESGTAFTDDPPKEFAIYYLDYVNPA